VNWDDLKFFLAVCKYGSIRGAARSLDVNHATVSRRINNFEASLGKRLFERTAQGYIQTALANELFQEASFLEERMNTVQRRIISNDDSLKGDIRVTFPECLGQAVLMEDIADFCRLYPQVNVHAVGSVRTLNLLNRETDVAFRICEEPPDYVVGRKLATIHRACYISRKLLPKLNELGWLEQQHWLGWSDKLRRPIGLIAKEYPRLDSQHQILSVILRAEACKQGMGVAILPCSTADNDPDLVRIPPYVSEAKYALWILSHPDMRKNQKIKTFVHFMTKRVLAKRALLEGEEFDFPEAEVQKVTQFA
jgi:DNA-binding transcriptional LysR family regulator